MGKKNQIVGREQYINQSTGELVELDLIESVDYEKDINFYKIFLKKFDTVLDKIGNQKIRVFIWILEHISWDNKLPYTFRQISKETGTSYAVVAKTMKNLQEIDFLRKHNTGMYIVNPDIIFRGTYQRRCRVAMEYDRLKHQHQMDSYEDDLVSVQKKIKRLQEKEKSIQQRMDIIDKCKD